jgi:hypothetical protein
MTPKSLTAVLVLSAAVATVAGCGHSMERVNPASDDDVGGTLIDSADMIAATDKAAADLADALLKAKEGDIIVAPARIKNESVQPLNTGMIDDRMLDQLVRKCGARVRFLSRADVDEVIKEREGKREGVYAPTEQKALLGAHYLMTGRITSLSKRADGDRADYFVLAFKLVDAEDSHLAWTNNYEFKKVGDAGVIYQ